MTPNGPTWTENILHDFNLSNGSYPENLIMDQSGNLYGVATGYGDPIPANVFELTPENGNWIFYNLEIVPNCGDPESGIIIDAAGNFYGTCAGGGAYGFGWVFELTNSGGSWIITDLHDFDLSDGYDPSGDLVLDASGNLYGTARAGGINNNGLSGRSHPRRAPWPLGGWRKTTRLLLVLRLHRLPRLNDLRFAYLAVAAADEHIALIHSTTYLLS